MLTLILGRGKSGKTTRLLQLVKACPAQGMAQRIVIVPEQLSHQTERMLSAVCGDGISFVSEVLSFTRLQDRVSSIYGGGATKMLDQGGRILTVRLALSSVMSRLKVFASSASRTDFLHGMVSMIDELKSYGVDAEQLLKASKSCEGFFSQKLQELASILAAYDAVMAQGCCDPRDRLTLLRHQLLDTEYAAGRHFFVDGFSDFSTQEYLVLEALLRRSEHLVVTVPWDNEEQEIFSTGRETASRLMRMANSLGHQIETISTSYQRDLPAELTYLEKYLFARQVEPFGGSCESVKLIVAQDTLEECRHCAAEMRRLAMSGIRWRDMAVAVGNPADYVSTMEEICQDYGIPLYTGTKTPLTAHPAAAFVLCAMDAVAGGMETEEVLAYLKSSYSGICPDDCDQLENYSYTWRIRGQKWQQPWTEHPDGYDGTFTPATQELLDELNQQKDQALHPLFSMRSSLKNASNVREQIIAVYHFLEETSLFAQINQQINAYAESGEVESAQETAQIWNTLMQCLQQIVSVLGELALDSGELVKIIRLALEQYELGTIPAVLDAVQFGNIESIRGSEPKVLFMLGCVEGSVPAKIEHGGLLSEREREILRNQMDIALAPDSVRAIEKQLYICYCALTAPTYRVYLFCAKEKSGKGQQPSFLLERIKQLFPDVSAWDRRLQPWEYMSETMLATLYFTAKQAEKSTLFEAIRRTASQHQELENRIVAAQSAAIPRQMTVPEALSKKLFGSPVNLTASRLNNLWNCPLSFFLNYGLKARPRKEATFDATEYGTFLHYILEHSVDAMLQTLPPSPEESHRLVQQFLTPYLETRLQDPDVLTPRQKYVFHRNGREAEHLLLHIAQEFASSDFRPCAYELQFGADKAMGTLTVSGERGQGSFHGTVDRVDLWKGPEHDFFRIIDYKSGSSTKFDYTKLYGGVGMQLFLYLFTLKHTGIPGVSEHPMPAGALYYPAVNMVKSSKHPIHTDEEERTLRKDDWTCTGLLLAEQTVLDAMAHDASSRDTLPISKKKNQLGNYCITPKQMEILEAFVLHRMGQAVDKVYDGQFAPEPFYRSPKSNPCTYCDYGEICQKDASFRASFYRPTLGAEDFWNLIGGEEHE